MSNREMAARLVADYYRKFSGLPTVPLALPQEVLDATMLKQLSAKDLDWLERIGVRID